MENEKNDKKYDSLLPYNPYYGENFTTYQTMPYECNRDDCHLNIGMTTDKIVKYYSYKIEEDFVVPTKL